MSEEADAIWHDANGREYFEEETALSEMLRDGVGV
jgi:hypothetical protein